MHSKNLSDSLPDQRHAGWLVGLSSAAWYMLLYQQSAGLGLLFFTIALVGFRSFLRKRVHWIDCLPLTVAVSACMTATGWHWGLWIASWAAVIGKELVPRQIPLHLHMTSGFQKALLTGHNLYDHFNQYSGASFKKGFSWIKMAVIPLVITLIFFVMYLGASPAFSEKWIGVLDTISLFFQDFKFAGILSILLGAVLGIWILLQPKMWPDNWAFPNVTTDVLRQKRASEITSLSSGLRREYRTGYMALLSVNVLLAFYHFVDIPWMWFEFGASLDSTFSYSQLVHEGTYLLIASILLSMGIMLYFFRGNMNFFSKSASLKNLSYLWIAQNALLVVSVAIRNYRYIDFDGLTYKRIGVIIFLVMCLFGLVTLVYKIAKGKSLSFLLGKNAGFALALGIMLSAAPWARWITHYNIDHYHETGRIDWHYLTNLDGTNLDLLWKAREEIGNYPETLWLESKTGEVLEKHQLQNWKSWSYTREISLKKLYTNSPSDDLRKLLLSEAHTLTH